jgi:3-hydroxyacyl-[acyl-carrier-protein] dehydratase
MRWMWIDRIVEFEPNVRMAAVKNVSLAEEHLHDHFAAGDGRPAMPIMPASLMIEGMAQTAGILVGSVNRFREKVILAKIATAVFEHDVTPGQTLRYEATLERIDASGASTTGIVRRLDHATEQWTQIGRVDLLFSHIDRNMAGVSFPEENFVFSENFRTILNAAGLGDLADDAALQA